MNNKIYSIINDVTFTLILFLMIILGINNIVIENRDLKKNNKENKTIVIKIKDNNSIYLDREYNFDEFDKYIIENKELISSALIQVNDNVNYYQFFRVISLLTGYGIDKIGVEKTNE